MNDFVVEDESQASRSLNPLDSYIRPSILQMDSIASLPLALGI